MINSDRIKYSQNFLKETSLVQELVDKSTINSSDQVLEVGPGKGIITDILATKSKNVIAIEADHALAHDLQNKFASTVNTEIIHGNFLIFNLPSTTYKVFSNIPFNITSDIVRKLLQSNNPPTDCYLIIQKEAAFKFAGSPYCNETLFSVLAKPWFEMTIVHEFKRSDFAPQPSVETVFLRITKRVNPMISNKLVKMYKDFVTFIFNRSIPSVKNGLESLFTYTQFKFIKRDIKFTDDITPTQFSFEQWLNLFRSFDTHVDQDKKKIVVGSHDKLTTEQQRLDKINRTRTAKDWKTKK